MKKPMILTGLTVILALVTVSPAAAHDRKHGKQGWKHGKQGKHSKHSKHSWKPSHGKRSTFTCNGDFAQKSVRNVVVPPDGSCTLTDSIVKGDVRVRGNGYFQATRTRVGDEVEGHGALTIFIDDGSTVGGGVRAVDTAQIFVFNSTVAGHISVEGADDKVYICGTTVRGGDIRIRHSRRDILVGDPQAADCAGNTVKWGTIQVERNFTDVELVIRGNAIPYGNLQVFGNSGPADKFVQDNAGGHRLECSGNEQPFEASGNTGWKDKRGQCSQVTECSSLMTGATLDDVVVPPDAECTLADSTVNGNVLAAENAYFQSTGTEVKGNVKGERALTIFVDTGSTVHGNVRADWTFQVFAFNSSVTGDIEVRGASDRVQVCGNTVLRGDIEVERSGRDILIGDPEADCAGNTVAQGEIEAKRNFTDVEFVIRGNTISSGDLEVFRNQGPVPKFVQGNTGGDELECAGNQAPFTASSNTGWTRTEGQCAGPAAQSEDAAVRAL